MNGSELAFPLAPHVDQSGDMQVYRGAESVRTQNAPTYTVRLYLSGPIEVAKQVIRQDCLEAGLCVTVEPTTFIYTGGEEAGYAVGLLNYPRFPSDPDALTARARALALRLLEATFQHSALVVAPGTTEWITKRDE